MELGIAPRMNRIFSGRLAGLIFGIVALGVAAANATTNQVKFDAAYGRVPLHFEANEGQVNSPARFLARGRGYAIHLSPGQVDFVLSSPETNNAPRHARGQRSHVRTGQRVSQLRMTLAGGNVSAPIIGESAVPTKINYFIGNDSANWRTNIATFHQVRYETIYPGVDLVLYGNQQEMEYDFVVAPGADTRSIRFEVEGARRLEINAAGDLVLHTTDGQLRQRKPVAYQVVNGVRQPVEARYRVARNSVGFQVGQYDHSLPLVIDPVLVYSTYLGGSGNDRPYGLAVDTAGNAYFGGYTVGTLPNITPGAYDTNYAGSIHVGGDGGDAYVGKLNPTGTAFEFLTYLGGTEAEVVDGVAIDSAGNVYVTGNTWSGNFPTTAGVVQPNHSDPYWSGYPNYTDAFVTKLNSNGAALVYSTYLGGLGFDSGFEITLDNVGNSYVTGATTATNFPLLNAFQTTKHGGAIGWNGNFANLYEGFVTKLNTNGSALVFSSYLGGSADEWPLGITLDASNAVYVTGWTVSTDFPRANAFQTNYGGGAYDGFVMKISPGGSNLLFSYPSGQTSYPGEDGAGKVGG